MEANYSEVDFNVDKSLINIHKINKIDFDKIKKIYPNGYGYNVINNKKDVEWVEVGKINFFLKKKGDLNE